MDVSRRRFLRGGLSAGMAAATCGWQAKALNGKPEEMPRDVVAVLNMIRLNLFGQVMHCVGGPEQLGSIRLFLGMNRWDRFARIVKVESAGVTTNYLETATGKTATIHDDRSVHQSYARIFRVEGTRGIWMQELNRIHLSGISTPGVWEDFGPYRDKYARS